MMDIISQIKTVDMILKGLRGDLQHITPYDFVPEKQRYLTNGSQNPLLRSTPEEQGVPSGHLERFFKALDACPDISPHSVLVLRHGRLIGQAHWKPYSGAYAQMTYSLSKSVTAMAVGMAVEDKLFSLDDRICDLFSDRMPPFRNPRINSVTVRHLLDMTSGVRFNEFGSMMERDWVRAYLQSDCAFEPGGEFAYNSMNSYILSALLRRKTGKGLVEYLTPRLFQPLGIENVFWEKCPMGVEKGGWGLYLRPEDMAKLGQLYLQKGAWTVDGKKRRLVPERWVEESVKIRVRTKMGEHETGYGYHLWSFPIEGAYQFNGVFGQYVIVIPGLDVVIAMTSGSHGLFIDTSAAIIREYFGDGATFFDNPLPADASALHALVRTVNSLAVFPETVPQKPPRNFLQRIWRGLFGGDDAEKLPELAAALDKKAYLLENSFGTLMPFILQGVRNNFCAGISRVAFSFEPGVCTVVFTQGKDVCTVKAGLDGVPRRGGVSMNGELYAVGGSARLTTDEDDHTVLKLFISFIETPHTRIIKFIFDGDSVLVRFDELPSVDSASKLALSLISGSGALEKLLNDTISQQRITGHVRKILLPKAVGKRTQR